MVYQHLPHPSYELETAISHSNLKLYSSIEKKKKYLESLQMNI